MVAIEEEKTCRPTHILPSPNWMHMFASEVRLWTKSESRWFTLKKIILTDLGFLFTRQSYDFHHLIW
jgi:hypothetical protein